MTTTLSSEGSCPIKSLGPGWQPISTVQQFRFLHKGPLYPPECFPIIPPPFLVNVETGDLPPAAAENSDVPSYPTPAYRTADPIAGKLCSSGVYNDDDDDEPLCSVLPRNLCFPVADVAPHLLEARRQERALSPDAEQEEDASDLSIAHEAVISMFRLGRPKHVSEETFLSSAEDLRDALARQRRLFPNIQRSNEADGGGKAVSKFKSASTAAKAVGSLKVSAAATRAEEDGTAVPASMNVDNPRVVTLCYSNPVLAAAAELLDVATSSGSATIPDGAEGKPCDEHVPKQAAWDYATQFAANIAAVLKRAETHRKKQQLFVGFGRSVAFERVDGAPGTAPIFKVNVERRESIALSASPARQPSMAVAASTAEPDDSGVAGDQCELETVATAASEVYSPLSSSDNAEHSKRVVAVKSMGDPKAMQALDKCEWEKEDLEDKFDVLAGGLQATKLVATDPLGWLSAARASETSAVEVVTLSNGFAGARSMPVAPSTQAKRPPLPKQVPLLVQTAPLIPARPDALCAAPEAAAAATGAPSVADYVEAAESKRKVSRSDPPKGVVPAAAPSEQTSTSAKKPPVPGRGKALPVSATPDTASVESPLPPEEPKKVALSAIASLFASKDADKNALPPGLPPLTIVFSPFMVQSSTVPWLESDRRRLVVSFSQERPFYLRPPRDVSSGGDDEDGDEEEEEFWDDAVEALQQDMDDELLPPMTPPSSPVSWVPVKEERFTPAPFTQLLIDRLEAGVESRRGSSDDDDDEETTAGSQQPVGGAVGGDGKIRRSSRAVLDDDGVALATVYSDESVKQMLQAATAAALTLEDDKERRNALIREQLRMAHHSADGDAATERNIARFMQPSVSRRRPRGQPLLLSTRPPLRLEGTTSVVRRLMKRSKRDVLALAQKSKEQQLVSFRPSRHFLAAVLRMRSFGSLMVALLSNPDDPTPESAVSVSLGDLGDRLTTVWENVRNANSSPPTSDALLKAFANNTHDSAAWAMLRDELASVYAFARAANKKLHKAEKTPHGTLWKHVVSLKDHERPPDNVTSKPDTANSNHRGRVSADERVVLRDAPFFPHFLPRPSTTQLSGSSTELPPVRHRGQVPTTSKCVAPAQALANMRRVPRSHESRGGLDVTYDSTQPASVFARHVGGVESSKRQFSAKQVALRPVDCRRKASTPSTAALPPWGPSGATLQCASGLHPPQVYPLPVEILPSAIATSSGGMQRPNSRGDSIWAAQRQMLQTLHEVHFESLHPSKEPSTMRDTPLECFATIDSSLSSEGSISSDDECVE